MTSRAEVIAGERREEKGKGVGRRLLSRMRTVLKRSDPSKRHTTQPTASAPPPSTAAAPPTAPVATINYSQTPQPESDSALPKADDTPPVFAGEKVSRAQIYDERSRHLSERFGLEMHPENRYQMDGHVLRVHKPLRMRVHRQCHQCGAALKTTAGAHCDTCDHSFCRQCTRYPAKRDEAELAASRARRAEVLEQRAADAMIPPDWDLDPNPTTVVLRRPVKPCVQKELVYKKVRQRVRRMCCNCQDAGGPVVVFQGGKRNCPKCDHVRCTDCPRDPPKKDKYPYGYPGDEFGVKSIPHHRCHECFSDYPPGVENGTPCASCSHEKCDNCERLRPQKVEPKLDPEVVRGVQEKLAGVDLT